MITLAPKESKPETLPQQVGELVLSNETIASVDLKVEIEDSRLKVTIEGISLGKTQETPFEDTKKTWRLG